MLFYANITSSKNDILNGIRLHIKYHIMIICGTQVFLGTLGMGEGGHPHIFVKNGFLTNSLLYENISLLLQLSGGYP